MQLSAIRNLRECVHSHKKLSRELLPYVQPLALDHGITAERQ